MFLPTSHIELPDAVGRLARKVYSYEWAETSLTAKETSILRKSQEAEASRALSLSLVALGSQLANLGEQIVEHASDDLMEARWKDRARDRLLRRAWDDLRHHLYDGQIGGQVFLISGQPLDVPFFGWISPLNDSSYINGVLLLRLEDGRSVSGLGRLFDADFKSDFPSDWSSGAAAGVLISAAPVSSSLPNKPLKKIEAARVLIVRAYPDGAPAAHQVGPDDFYQAVIREFRKSEDQFLEPSKDTILRAAGRRQ